MFWIANRKSQIANLKRAAVALLSAVLFVVTLAALWVGYQRLDIARFAPMRRLGRSSFNWSAARFDGGLSGRRWRRRRGAAALFRNPLAEPLTLGVSGGGALGASVALALGLGARIAGLPIIFIFSFLGAGAAVIVVYRLARTTSGAVVLPGALLLAGGVLNLIAAAGVVIIQYFADYTRALQILRWTIGSLDVVGSIFCGGCSSSRARLGYSFLDGARLHLLAMDEETAASLGVNVRRSDRMVYIAASLVVGVTVAVGGTSLCRVDCPHAVRLAFGEDVRVVVPCSFLLGAAFLMVADAVARTGLGAGECRSRDYRARRCPVFLWLLRRQQRYSAM